MSLRDTLKVIVESVEGGLAAIIMASDGIPIDQFVAAQAGFDVQLLTVEYAALLKEIRRTVELVKAGRLEEVSISTDRARVILRVLSDELFVVLAMAKSGNFGKGRYLLRLKSDELARELC